MSITVTCPGCKKKFTVSDKFAGMTGPCKYCKTKITIPKVSEQVIVHGGEAFADGGRNAQGKLVLKPLTRAKQAFNQNKAIFIALGIIAVLLGTYILGKVIDFSVDNWENWIIASAGLCVITPVIVGGMYPLVKKEEMLENIHGFELYWRTAVISAAYVGIWSAVSYLMTIGVLNNGSPLSWAIYVLLLAAFGAFITMCFYELEWTSAIFHTITYLSVTLLLRYLIGIIWFTEYIVQSTGGGNVPPPPPFID